MQLNTNLSNIIVGHDVVILKFKAQTQFFNTDGKIISRQRDYTDVLEMDNGKVSVSRRYGK